MLCAVVANSQSARARARIVRPFVLQLPPGRDDERFPYSRRSRRKGSCRIFVQTTADGLPWIGYSFPFERQLAKSPKQLRGAGQPDRPPKRRWFVLGAENAYVCSRVFRSRKLDEIRLFRVTAERRRTAYAFKTAHQQVQLIRTINNRSQCSPSPVGFSPRHVRGNRVDLYFFLHLYRLLTIGLR